MLFGRYLFDRCYEITNAGLFHDYAVFCTFYFTPAQIERPAIHFPARGWNRLNCRKVLIVNKTCFFFILDVELNIPWIQNHYVLIFWFAHSKKPSSFGKSLETRHLQPPTPTLFGKSRRIMSNCIPDKTHYFRFSFYHNFWRERRFWSHFKIHNFGHQARVKGNLGDTPAFATLRFGRVGNAVHERQLWQVKVSISFRFSTLSSWAFFPPLKYPVMSHLRYIFLGYMHNILNLFTLLCEE